MSSVGSTYDEGNKYLNIDFYETLCSFSSHVWVRLGTKQKKKAHVRNVDCLCSACVCHRWRSLTWIFRRNILNVVPFTKTKSQKKRETKQTSLGRNCVVSVSSNINISWVFYKRRYHWRQHSVCRPGETKTSFVHVSSVYKHCFCYLKTTKTIFVNSYRPYITKFKLMEATTNNNYFKGDCSKLTIFISTSKIFFI